MAIKIPIVSDVSDALRGAGKIADAYEDVQDSLDDVVKDARKVEDALEDIGDGSKKASDESDDMAKKFRDDFDKVRKDAKGAGDDVGRSFKDGTDRASQGAEEFRDESRSIAQETATSFDGTADSIADVFKDLAATAFAGFGPAGLVAGVAAAAGIGIAQAKLEEIAEETNEAKEAGAEWAQSFNSASVEEKLSALRDRWQELGTTIVDSREWYELGQENAVSALDQIGNAAEDNGELVRDFTRAFNETDPSERLDLLNRVLEDTSSRLDDMGPAWRASLGGPETEAAYLEKREALRGLREQTEEQIRTQENANETERLSAEALGITVEQLREYNGLSDESKDAIDQVAEGQKGLAIETQAANDELEDQLDLTRDLIGTELDWLDTLDGLTKQVEDNGTSLSRNTAKGRDNLRYILDATDGIDDLYDSVLAETGSQERAASARDKATRELVNQARAAGFSEDEVRKLIRRVNQMPRSKTTDIRADTGPARKSLTDFINLNPNDIGVGVRADTSRAADDVADFRYRTQSIPVHLQLRAV